MQSRRNGIAGGFGIGKIDKKSKTGNDIEDKHTTIEDHNPLGNNGINHVKDSALWVCHMGPMSSSERLNADREVDYQMEAGGFN